MQEPGTEEMDGGKPAADPGLLRPGQLVGHADLHPSPELWHPESSLPGGPTPCLQSHLASGVTPVGPGQAPQDMRPDPCVPAGVAGAMRGRGRQGSRRHGGQGEGEASKGPKGVPMKEGAGLQVLGVSRGLGRGRQSRSGEGSGLAAGWMEWERLGNGPLLSSS